MPPTSNIATSPSLHFSVAFPAQSSPGQSRPRKAVAVHLASQQRAARLNGKLLRGIVDHLVSELFPAHQGQLGICFVTRRRMATLNERFLGHPGPTDVITFDYEPRQRRRPSTHLCGDIFICVEVAQEQARQFGVPWPEELVRYVVHGLLHLAGETDAQPRARAAMKKKENRWMKRLRRRCPLSRVSLGPRVTVSSASTHRRGT